MSAVSPLASGTATSEAPGCRQAAIPRALNSGACHRLRRAAGAEGAFVSPFYPPKNSWTQSSLPSSRWFMRAGLLMMLGIFLFSGSLCWLSLVSRTPFHVAIPLGGAAVTLPGCSSRSAECAFPYLEPYCANGFEAHLSRLLR